MKNQPFLNDEEFFKSNVLSGQGLLVKAGRGGMHKYWKKVGTGKTAKYFYKDPKTRKVIEGPVPEEKGEGAIKKEGEKKGKRASRSKKNIIRDGFRY